MICFNCGYKLNSENAEKCKVCGAGFPLKCSECKNPNPSFAKFCLTCGANLNNDIKPDDSGKLAENRKNVAVIFADISRFTAISEKLDPEEVRDIINNCFQYITKPVYELEGTIDKYMGDCVMILFGARYTHNDDSMRAVKCAMRMMKRIEEFSKENYKKLGTEIGLSIGINYGLVVTGKVGNFYDDDYTVMGDVVNTAQRLQSVANRGNILVSDSVYEETNELFHYSACKYVELKNKENPVACYQPVSLVISKVSENEQLVPRIEELDYINKAYDNRDSVNHMAVIGESGAGKTTLVRTFLAEKGEDIKHLWISCNTMSKQRPYSTVSSVLSGILNIDPNDTTRIKTNRLRSFIDYILRDYSEEIIIRNYNFIALVMGLDRDSDFVEIINAMEYDDLNRELISQISLFFANLDKRQNRVIVIDDVHLADIESINVLSEMKGFTGLFIIVSQYLEGPAKDISNTLELNRFSMADTRKLISLMMNEDNIDNDFVDEIYKITNGNPMFIHEILQTILKKELYTIKDSKLYLKKDSLKTLPRNLKNTILHNISELDETSMNFLGAAAVAGTSFNLSWILESIDDMDEAKIIMMLTKLNIIEFTTIQKTSGASDKIYSFTQDTIRRVVYDSLLNENKRSMHAAIAKKIEDSYSRELDNYYEVLGYHYSSAGITRQAMKYYLLSADKLMKNYIYNGASEYYDKYIDLAESFEKFTDTKMLVTALISKADIMINTSDFENAKECLDKAAKVAVQGENINKIKLMKATILKETAKYEEALEILDQLEPMLSKNSNLFGKSLQLRCAVYLVLGRPGVINLVSKSEEILLKSRDYSSLAETMSQAGIKHFFSGNPGEAIEYFEKALEYAGRSNNQSVVSKVSINLGIIYHATGEIDKSFVYLSNSMEASEKISNVKNYLSAEINLGIFYMEKGLFSKSCEMFDDAINKSENIGLFYQTCLALLNKADVEYEIGNYSNAEDLYSGSLEIAKKYNMTVEIGLNYLGIAKTDISMEDYKNVPGLLEKALKVFEETEEIQSVGDFYYYKSIYLYDNEKNQDALEEINKAIENAKQTNENIKLTKAVRKKGDILIRMGKESDAEKEYSKSVQLADETGSFYEQAKSYFCRYQFYKSEGQIEKAASDLKIAKQYINEIDYCKWTNSILEEH